MPGSPDKQAKDSFIPSTLEDDVSAPSLSAAPAAAVAVSGSSTSAAANEYVNVKDEPKPELKLSKHQTLDIVQYVQNRGGWVVPIQFILAGLTSNPVSAALLEKHLLAAVDSWASFKADKGMFFAASGTGALVATLTFIITSLAVTKWNQITVANELKKIFKDHDIDLKQVNFDEVINNAKLRGELVNFLFVNWAVVCKEMSKMLVGGALTFTVFPTVVKMGSLVTKTPGEQFLWNCAASASMGLGFAVYAHVVKLQIPRSLIVQTGMGLMGMAQGVMVGESIIQNYGITNLETQAQIRTYSGIIGSAIGALTVPIAQSRLGKYLGGHILKCYQWMTGPCCDREGVRQRLLPAPSASAEEQVRTSSLQTEASEVERPSASSSCCPC